MSVSMYPSMVPSMASPYGQSYPTVPPAGYPSTNASFSMAPAYPATQPPAASYNQSPAGYPAYASATAPPSPAHTPHPVAPLACPSSVACTPIVNRAYCVPTETVLVMREDIVSMSGDDFTVTDIHGRFWFKMDSKCMSINDKRYLLDSSGRPVCSMRRKTMSLHNSWHMFRGTSFEHHDRVLTIQPKILSLKPYVNVYLNDGDKIPDYVCKGNFLAKSFTIYRRVGGQDVLVAQCNKQSRFESHHAYISNCKYDKQTYYVRVQPGVDAAFIVALCVAIDETYHD